MQCFLKFLSKFAAYIPIAKARGFTPLLVIVKESLQYAMTAYPLQIQADTAYLPAAGLKMSKFFTIPPPAASGPAQALGNVSY